MMSPRYFVVDMSLHPFQQFAIDHFQLNPGCRFFRRLADELGATALWIG
jgi:hypothetical protein